jgi:hypothetical protein
MDADEEEKDVRAVAQLMANPSFTGHIKASPTASGAPSGRAAPARGASSSCKIKRGVERQAAAHTGLARTEADRRMRICAGAFVQQVEVYLDGDLPAELPELSDEYVCGTQPHQPRT